MDITLIRIFFTVTAMAAFAAIVWWAYSPASKARFEQDARLPFEGDEF